MPYLILLQCLYTLNNRYKNIARHDLMNVELWNYIDQHRNPSCEFVRPDPEKLLPSVICYCVNWRIKNLFAVNMYVLVDCNTIHVLKFGC